MSVAIWLVWGVFIAAPLLIGSVLFAFGTLFCEDGWSKAWALAGPAVFFLTVVASVHVLQALS